MGLFREFSFQSISLRSVSTDQSDAPKRSLRTFRPNSHALIPPRIKTKARAAPDGNPNVRCRTIPGLIPLTGAAQTQQSGQIGIDHHPLTSQCQNPLLDARQGNQALPAHIDTPARVQRLASCMCNTPAITVSSASRRTGGSPRTGASSARPGGVRPRRTPAHPNSHASAARA